MVKNCNFLYFPKKNLYDNYIYKNAAYVKKIQLKSTLLPNLLFVAASEKNEINCVFSSNLTIIYAERISSTSKNSFCEKKTNFIFPPFVIKTYQIRFCYPLNLLIFILFVTMLLSI